MNDSQTRTTTTQSSRMPWRLFVQGKVRGQQTAVPSHLCIDLCCVWFGAGNLPSLELTDAAPSPCSMSRRHGCRILGWNCLAVPCGCINTNTCHEAIYQLDRRRSSVLAQNPAHQILFRSLDSIRSALRIRRIRSNA
ncbi:hypothetical protein GMOD_00004329 [Pyrenophora seminiperda CCB06]|uniref:Uncharacterized protein n=1 Tax=Pyrenophora seminiperda CCB06 TaxID=1302712 RepID=A0A3M7M0X4_9PLEO|nr:hypothetical protein GMOD_00004329 [Pyrenophora seminiperda CCB06]